MSNPDSRPPAVVTAAPRQGGIGGRILGRTPAERLLVAAVATAVYLALRFAPGDDPAGPTRAYIGPGAGIAIVGSVFTVLMAVIAAVFAVLLWPLRAVWRLVRGRKSYRKAKVRRVVVLGLDGLEPSLTEQYMQEGLLPNLASLRQQGTYVRLGSTWPPISPVAWSSFSTGTNPGKHNIFDFIARTRNYQPTISSVRMRASKRRLRIGGYQIPLGRTQISNLRMSKPFWAVLGESGVLCSVLRVPITYPPDRFRGMQLSAMCVPDLRGTQGMFSYYVEEGPTGTTTDGDVGGDRILVHRSGNAIRSFLRGPVNSLRPDGAELRVPFVVREAPDGESGVLELDGQRYVLPSKRYSQWIPVAFRAAPGVKIRGICKFYLKCVRRPFEMYCTPIQIDPDKPVMPISHPVYFSSYLARRQGAYATLGLAEDTWALSEKLLDEDAFLQQAYQIHEEREKMFFDALDNVRRGLIVCVFDGPDRIQHMFFRFIDDQHPALTPEQRASHRDAIRDMYRRMDDLVGRTIARLGPDAALFVMSDHGFKTFRRGVDLNRWLRDNGYLFLKGGKDYTDESYLRGVDWTRTRAYAVGLAGIYLNVKGREAHGIVPPEQVRPLTEEICARLTGLVDPEHGQPAVREAVPRWKVYRGPYTENAPDVIVGYNVGWRVSWDAAIGKCGRSVFSDNLKAWSGDHCVHPELVPGVLFSNLKLRSGEANIVDLAPTALELFGVPKPAYMDGNSLLDGDAAAAARRPAGRQPALATA